MGRALDSSAASHVAFLMTDIEGSTPLWEQDPAAMGRALATHDAIIEREVDRAGGRLLTHRGEGDSAFAVFSDPKAAVACAVTMQRAFTEESWPTPSSLRVRIGLHVGNALGRDAEYVQPAVNRCARLRDLASGGQILASGDCVRAAEPAPGGATFRYLGDHTLRGLEGPVAIFQIGHPALPGDFPDIAQRDGRLGHNLPAEPTSFVGRERELKQVADLLASNRLVTLTGTGGVGKTRLALRLARTVRHRFPDGAWFVDLAVLSDPRLIPDVVAATLKVLGEPGRRLKETLDAFLADRRPLLILDNCEHLVDEAAAFAAGVLKTAPGVTMLATSREALRIAGEHTVVLEPLELTDPDEAEPGEAATLFIDRAELAGTALEHSSDVNAICSHLDGLPLAIELAASWAPVMSPAEIVEGLADRFRLLSTGLRGALPKHETLRASVDWSYALLEESERVLFRRLSVFAGPFTIDAVKRVCAQSSSEEEDAMTTVAGLVRKSLVVVADRSRRPTRYRLLETLRAYGAERLDEAGETGALRDRLAAYVDVLCQSAERRLGVADWVWTTRLNDERDNVRAALEWTRTRDPERFLRICGALTVHWVNTARYSEGRTWLTAAAAIEGAAPELMAKARWGLGYVNALEFNFAAAVAPLQQALEIFRSLGDDRGVARCLTWLGLILAFAVGKTAAQPMLDEGIALGRATDDRFSLVTGLLGLGIVLGVYEQAPSAHDVFVEAAGHARRLGDPVSIAAAVNWTGMSEFFSGEYLRAHVTFRESVALGAAARSPVWLGSALTFLGATLSQLGRHEEAQAALDEGASASGRHAQADNSHWRSRVALNHGDVDEAATLIEGAFAAPMARAFLFWSLYEVQHLQVLADRGENEAAREKIDRSIARFRDAGARWALGRTLLIRSRVEWALGDRPASLAALREAVEVVSAFGDRATIVDVVEWAAELAQTVGDAATAARLLGASGRIRSETGYAVAPLLRTARNALRARIVERLEGERFVDEMKLGEASTDAEALGLAAAVGP